jgi:O-Antigen ligase
MQPSRSLPGPAPPPTFSGGALLLPLRFYPLCWLLFLIAAPVYVFASGLPQPGDGLMAFMILILATGYVLRAPVHTRLYFVASLFLGYVAIVNWFWRVDYTDTGLLLAPLYYAYNFGASIVVLSMFREFKGRFVTITRLGLALAVAVELAACLFLPGGGVREVGTFNNPNQLGYWSLLTMACWLVLKGDERLALRDLILMAAVGYIITLSLSRAALLAFVGLLVFGVACQRVERTVGWGSALVVAIVAMIMITQPILVEGLLASHVGSSIVSRAESSGEHAQDSWSGRGYDRFWLYPEYVLTGAGEGAFERFSRSRVGALEMHSTFGTLLFSYGIIGFVLFCLLLYQVFRNAPIKYLIYFIPICVYGLTHQGLRLTLFWVFFALVFSLSRNDLGREKSSAAGDYARPS